MDDQNSFLEQVMNGITRAVVFSVITLLAGVGTFASAEEVTQQYKGMTLNGMLELAEGKSVADGIILITHSLIQHNQREPIPYVQELLKEKGYSSLAINYSLGLDNRHGPFDCMATHRYTLDQSLEEIGIWVKWLKEKGARKLILLGHSYGGNEIARYAANNDEVSIRGVVLLGPGTADHRMWSPGGYKIRYGKELNDILEHAELLVASGKGETIMENVDFIFCPQANVSAASFVSYYRVSPERLLPNLMKSSKKPTLFIAASEDNRLPDLNRLVKPFVDGELNRLVVIEGAGHFFLDLHSDDAVEQAVKFFQEIKL
ncbi:MAG: alpha/beta hydrolase [Gammaproteobacteria bacterium]|nr:MAG: alpha/beta hydrolase [Gammaproteobacteria bacterium]